MVDTTIYGADGRISGRTSTDSQGTTTVYDAAGRKSGSVTGKPRSHDLSVDGCRPSTAHAAMTAIRNGFVYVHLLAKFWSAQPSVQRLFQNPITLIHL